MKKDLRPSLMSPKASEHFQYLDPIVLSSIGSLELVARLVVEGFISGLHQSPYRGFNVEFTEHRPYSPGDEIRHIDWHAYAKVDRFLVKQFEEETNLRAYLLLDSSRSMGYGGKGRLPKIEYAKVLCASLAYLMLMQRDGVGLVAFSDRVQQYVPPRAKASHFEAITDSLAAGELGQDTRFEPVLAGVAERIRRRGLVMVASDLIDEPAVVLKGLRHLRHLKHDLILFHILDPDEIELPFRGSVRFRDPESQGELLTDPGRLLEDYQERIQAFIQTYRDGAVEIGIDYVLLRTSDPLDRALAAYLAGRRSLLAGRRFAPAGTRS